MNKQLTFIGVLMCFLFACFGALAEDSTKDCCNTGQNLTPIKQVGMYLDGYHTYRSQQNFSSQNQIQIRTAHYCKQINPDMFQCLLYDSNGPQAKVIGIEYVITDKLFKTLPASEQKLWHPHDSEVDSGLLIMPGLPEEKQKEILSALKTTHGKTWQVWPDLKDSIPMGKPALMWNVDAKKISSATRQSVASRKNDPTF